MDYQKVLLDVRMDNSVNITHIKDFFDCHEYLYIPFDELIYLDLEGTLPKDKIYYIICNRGNKSKYIKELMKSYGYNAVNVEGGVERIIEYKAC